MEKFVCENCGGTDFEKREKSLLCHTCGAVFSFEDIRKLFGTLITSENQKLACLFIFARKAAEDGDGANAIKYYEMILLDLPKCSEALFFIAYFRMLGYESPQCANPPEETE